MSRVFSSWAGRAACLALVMLLAALMVLGGTPGQRKASAEGGLGTTVIITAIVEFLGGFYDVGLDKLCDWLFENDPDYEDQIAEIKASLGEVDQEFTNVTSALNDISTVIDQLEDYEIAVYMQNETNNIMTSWENFKASIWGTGVNPTQEQIANFCRGAMNTYNLETSVRRMYNYMSHNNQPRSVLDKYTDLLIDSGTTVGSTEDFSAKIQTTDGSKVVVERPMYFDYKGWTGGHDVMGAAAPQTDFYFAEGTARPGFETYMCLQNTEKRDARVKLTYMTGDGATKEQDVTVPGSSRFTVRPADIIGSGDGADFDFSTSVRSTNGVGIVAERPMYFNYQGAWSGGHDIVGATAPRKDFYFAEGTCRPGFDSYLCVQNPGDSATGVTATFMKGDGTVSDRTFDVPAHSRYTLKAADVIGTGDGASFDFSTRVHSDGAPIVAERPVYFNYQGTWTGGHDVMGAEAPGRDFYFAEGTCRPGFHPYICLQNPGNDDSTVALTYMKGDGTTADQQLLVPAHSRATVSPRDVLGEGDDAAHDFSTRVRCLRGSPIVAERPMYFNYKSNWTGGHNVMGSNQARNAWYFAEGTIRDGFVPYFCIQNPGDTTSNVRITYMGTDGRETRKDVAVPAHSRKTVSATSDLSNLMNSYCGLEQYFSQLIHQQVMGADMILEAKNFDPVSYGSPDDYLNNSLAPMLREEVNAFKDNAQRLVMAQAALANSPSTNGIYLGTDGAAVLSRADFVCQQLANKALNDKASKLMGTAIATQDVIPAGGSMVLKAYNKTTGTTQDAAKTTVLPEYGPDMADPYNATNWKVSGMEDFYYDQWNGTTVSSNNNVSIILYEFNDVSPGTYYDILDSNGNAVLENVPVAKYDDSFNQSGAGDNVFGDFTLTLRGSAGGQQLMSGWKDVVVTDTDNAYRGDDYNTSTLAPKHLSACMHSHGDAGDNRQWQGYGYRSFVSGMTGQAWIMADYSTAGEPDFVDDHDCDGLKMTAGAAGDYAEAEYWFTLYDQTAAAETALLDKSWKIEDSTGTTTKSVNDSWTNYTTGDGVNPAKIPMSVNLVNGHTYQVRLYVKAKGKGIGCCNSYASIDVTLNNLYLMFTN